ncbi:hypothetical protein [Roseovarius sp.]
MLESLKLQAVLMVLRKMIPVILGAVGGFVAANYPEVFGAFCTGGM